MLRRLALVLMAAIVVTGAWWSGRQALVPPSPPEVVEEQPAYTVAEGTVEDTIDLAVLAEWKEIAQIYSVRGGVVTSVDLEPGELVQDGDTIVSIELVPTFVIEGDIPMFRSLHQGIDGPDVTQIQRFLRARGFLQDDPDGQFGADTAAATRAWQSAEGMPPSGTIESGTVIFLAGLPRRVSPIISVGAVVNAGDAIATVIAGAPTLVAQSAPEAGPRLRSGQPIAVTNPDGHSWEGNLGSFSILDDGRYQFQVHGQPCSERCESIPTSGQTILSGQVLVTPRTDGPTVPMSAIHQRPDGSLSVTLIDGNQVPVTVVADSGGYAVVNGIAAGEQIRLPMPP
jgi:peptidoglycan hydrolase-like protein with peptidoglycan-binding domain